MVQMDGIAPRVKDFEIDLENGIEVSVEDQSKDPVTGVKIQAKELFSKICGVFVDSRIKGEEGVNSCNDSPNSNGVSSGQVKLEEGRNVDLMVKKVVKEKRKKMSNKKSSKPPRPPRGPSLDPADQKLIKEITEIAMLKRARVERMKTLKKMKGAKASSSNSYVFAMVFTVLFFLVILFQGMSSSRVTSVNVQGSTSAETPESGLIAVQYGGNPSTGDPNEPGFGPPNFVKSIAGIDSPENLRTAAR